MTSICSAKSRLIRMLFQNINLRHLSCTTIYCKNAFSALAVDVFSCTTVLLTLMLWEANLASTVPTFQLCTKYAGSLGIMCVRRRHSQLPHSFLGMDTWLTERSIHSQATWIIDVLGPICYCVIHGCLYNRSLTDVRSIGTGIKCLYCTKCSVRTFQ